MPWRSVYIQGPPVRIHDYLEDRYPGWEDRPLAERFTPEPGFWIGWDRLGLEENGPRALVFAMINDDEGDAQDLIDDIDSWGGITVEQDRSRKSMKDDPSYEKHYRSKKDDPSYLSGESLDAPNPTP